MSAAVTLKVATVGTATYIGQAKVGALASQPVWQIRKVTSLPGPDVTIQYANGSTAWDSIWDNRESYTYLGG